MNRNYAVLIAFAAWAATASTMSKAENIAWPELPTKGFISGRAAVEQDVKDGNAIFVAKVGQTVIGKPLSVKIPQYAYWRKSADKKVPVIVVQAEEANGTQIFGFHDLTGAGGAATGPEIDLLGSSHPK